MCELSPRLGFYRSFFSWLLRTVVMGSIATASCVTQDKLAIPIVPSQSSKKAFQPSESHLDLTKWNRTPECCVATGKEFAIASGGRNSSKCGEDILRLGGNVVDAAVATAFCLAVERPHSVSIAGGGFMLMHLANGKEQDVFIDFRETAPSRATKDMFLNANGDVVTDLNRNGALAVATPGFVAGLFEAQTKYGKLKGAKGWNHILQPALQLAKNGFPIYPSLAEKIVIRKNVIAADDGLKALLFKNNGEPRETGEILVQKDLATTLERIGKDGPKDFYRGKLAKKIAAHVKAKGGVLSAADLQRYQVKYRSPLVSNFRGKTIVTAPPPSAGGVLLLESLKIADRLNFVPGIEEDRYAHLLAETFKRSFADRYLFVGDPDFIQADPMKRLADDYISSAGQSIEKGKVTPASQIRAGKGVHDSHETTQLSVIDNQGNAVSATITLNYFFGSGLLVPGTGIILNDEMGDFEPKDDGLGNAVAPNKRPVSSMAPTIVLEGGKPVMAIGAAGGPYLITGLAQVILNRLVLGWSLRDAQFAPRLHHQWSPDKLFLEKNGFSPETVSRLQEMGYQIHPPSLYAQVQAVEFDPGEKTVRAVIDPRDEGGAVSR